MSRASVHIVADPGDDLATMQLLQGLADLEAGRAVVAPSPGGRDSAFWIARDVLIALGKRVTLKGTGRNAYELWNRTLVWSRAESVKDVFVLRAHLLGPRSLDRLVELGATIGANVWLIHQAAVLRRSHEEWASAHGLAVEPLSGFVDGWSDRIQPSASTHAESLPFPDVPRDECTTFRSSCRRLLDTPQYRTVDQTLRTAFERAREALDRETSPENVLACARMISGETSYFEDALTRLRGVQIAALHHRLVLRLDLPRLAAGWACDGPPIPSRDLAQRLRWQSCTRRAALGAIAATRAFAPSRLAALTISDARASITDATSTFGVDESLRPLVRAQILVRESGGAAADDPLFLSADPASQGAPMSARAVQTILRTLTRETGVLFPGSGLTARHDDDAAWARAAGLKVMVV